MKIPFHQFEQHIDETILKRGLAYYKQGQVFPPDEVSPGVYETVVAGSEEYVVRVEVKNDVVVDYTCNCPYDLGPVCKHVAAVLFYLQRDELGLEPAGEPQKAKDKKGAKAPAKKKKTVAEQVDELLEKIAHDELKQLVRELAAGDKVFRQVFLSRFAHMGEGESKEMYAQQVKAVLRAAKDRTGFIDWRAVQMVSKVVDELCVTAAKHAAERNYMSAIYISAAVLEEMTDALQFADDSSGHIGDGIRMSLDVLSGIAEKQVQEAVRKELLDYCFTAYKKKKFKDWDWHLGMLELAAQVVNTELEGEKLIAMLQDYRSGDDYSEYYENKLKGIQLEVLRKIKGEEEAEKFIENNLSTTVIREAAIGRAIASRNLVKAKQLILDGISLDNKIKAGEKAQWYDWLLKIAQIESDKAKTIEYARLLFMEGYKSRPVYYEILKANVVPGNWQAFVEQLVTDIISKKQWLDFDTIAWIFIQEQWWSKLLKLLQSNPRLSFIEHFEKYLAKDYSQELAELYEKGIIEYLKTATGRSHYKTAAQYIRRMRKLGEGQKADALAESLRRQYPQRPALLDELGKV
jgi:uncharacterized Zn finger protein